MKNKKKTYKLIIHQLFLITNKLKVQKPKEKIKIMLYYKRQLKVPENLTKINIYLIIIRKF